MIDTNANLSRWPFRRTPCDETGTLIDRLERSGITQAWVGSLDGLFHRDVGGVNHRLFVECQAHKTLVPFGTVNPTLPDWEEDLRRCHQNYAMPGIRLHPNYHGYTLDDPRFRRLLNLAAQRNLIVQLSFRMGDTRVQHHLMRVPDVKIGPLGNQISEVSGLRIMLINALQAVSPQEIKTIIKAGDVHVEISMLEGMGGITKLLQSIPINRVHWGSHLPLFQVESALLKLRESELSHEQLQAIRFKNSTRLLG